MSEDRYVSKGVGIGLGPLKLALLSAVLTLSSSESRG